MNLSLNASIVAYNNSKDKLIKAIDSVVNTKIKLYLIDNSPTDRLKELCNNHNIDYIFNKKNLGFGKAHNIAICKTLEQNKKYHLILNPDIYFEQQIISKIYYFMEENPDIGMVMPKILYPNGKMQFLCKLLPTPFDLLRRRFAASSKNNELKNYYYEMKFTGYDKIIDVPYLSGCFMFIRSEALRKCGLFDERFFMYLEDTDITRRIHKHFRTVYFPKVCAYHHYEKGSYTNYKLLFHHIVSTFSYFNKWGVWDNERKKINKAVLDLCKGDN